MRLTTFGALAIALSSAAAASAEDYHGVVYAGGSAGQGANGYLGTVVALPGASLGHGLALRGTVTGGDYRYRTDGILIRGRYVGGEVAMVYQMSGNWGWANLSAGGRVTDTTLRPIDPKNDRRGTRFDVGVQADGAFNLSPQWRMTYLGSVGVREGDYLVKADIGPFLDSKSQTRIGVEGALQGDPSYHAHSAGLFVSTQLAPATSLQLSGGVRDESGNGTGGYVALGSSILF